MCTGRPVSVEIVSLLVNERWPVNLRYSWGVAMSSLLFVILVFSLAFSFSFSSDIL